MMVHITTGPLVGKVLDLPTTEALKFLNDGAAKIDTGSSPPESASIDPRQEKAVIPSAKPRPI